MPRTQRVAIGINRAGRHIGDEIGAEDKVVRAGARRQSRYERDQADGGGKGPEKIVVVENGDDPFSVPVRCLTDFQKIHT
jgi:hypothetical protein